MLIQIEFYSSIYFSDDVDLHVFLDRNIWQASIMLINDESRNDEDENLKNWDNLDEWVLQENHLNQLKNSQDDSKSDIHSNFASRDTSNGLKSQIIPTSIQTPEQLGDRDYTSDTLNYPETSEKSDVASLSEMKDSYAPVLVGSANGSSDFMV